VHHEVNETSERTPNSLKDCGRAGRANVVLWPCKLAERGHGHVTQPRGCVREAVKMDLIFSLTRSAWMLIPVKEKYDHDPMPKNPFPAFGASLILCMVSMLQDIVLESWNHSFFPFTPLSHRPDSLTATLAYALDMTPQQRMRLSV
jgi:hypothetical protein